MYIFVNAFKKSRLFKNKVSKNDNPLSLKQKIPLPLLEYYSLEITARSAFNRLDITPNSTALLYCRVYALIAYTVFSNSSIQRAV